MILKTEEDRFFLISELSDKETCMARVDCVLTTKEQRFQERKILP
jgi:hypothetical protein